MGAEEVTEMPKCAKTLEQVTEKDNAEDQQVSQPQVPSQQTASRPSCNVVTPSRYCAIASLDEAAFDEEEEWKERTSIITKIDHELYQRYAKEFLHHITDEAVALAKPTATPTETDDRSKDEVVESSNNSPNDSFTSLKGYDSTVVKQEDKK